MTQLQTQLQNDAQGSSSQEVFASETSATEVSRVGHQEPGLIVVPVVDDGVAGIKMMTATGELQPAVVAHSESGEVLSWELLARSSRDAAVSGWFPGKLGGWVKLDWRDGGFAADAWTSDGAGMKAYDAAMRARAAKKRG